MAGMDLSQYSDDQLRAMLGSAPAAPAQRDFSQYSDEQLREMMKSSGPLANVPGEGMEKSVPKAIATAGILGGADVVGGTPGNLGAMVNYLGHRVGGMFKGQTREEATKASEENTQRQKEAQAALLTKAQEGMRSPSIWEKLGAMQLAGAGANMYLPTGEDVAAPLLERTGEYKPESAAGQAGMAGVRGAVGMLGPGAFAKGIKGAAQLAPVGGAASAIGDIVTQATGEPLAGMAAGALTPAAPKLTKGVKDFYDTTFRAKEGSDVAQRLADEKLAALARDLEKSTADATFQPGEIVPGSTRTLAEVTGDIGLAQGQKAAEIASPKFKEDMDAQRAQQNKARAEALREMSPEGANAMAPTQVLEAKAADIAAKYEAEVARLTQEARARADAMPDGMTPESVGQQLRESIAAAEKAADAATSALYAPLSKAGIKIVATPVREAADTIVAEVAKGKNQKPLAGEEAAIFERARKTNDVDRFSDIHDLEKRITNEVARNKRSPEGDPATISRLSKLKTSIRNAMNDAADLQAAYEQSLVDRGQMRPQDTLGYRLQREAEEFMAQRRGEKAPPVEDLQPNMTPELLEASKKAKGAHSEQMQTYEQGPVGETLANLGFEGQYKIPASGIPKLAFSAGDKGYTNAQAFLKAANGDPLAIAALKDAAVMRLREQMKSADVVDPKILASWKQKHANALRALDEASPGFSLQFDSAATATTALRNTETAVSRWKTDLKKEPAAKFLNLTHPDEVARVVGSMIEGGPTQIASVISSAGRNPAVINGMRLAGVQHMMQKLSNAAVRGGENVVSASKLSDFIGSNSGALELLYGAEGMKNMRLIAAELRSAEEALTSMRVQTGSDTAANLFPRMRALAGKSANAGTSALLYWGGLMEGVMKGDAVTAGLAASAEAGRHLLTAMRESGVSNINQLVERGLADPAVGRAMLQRGLDARGRLPDASVNRLAKALIASSPSIRGQQQQEERTGRATGGAVNLMALSKAAKKHVTQVTEPLLNESDDTVAHALAVAGKNI